MNIEREHRFRIGDPGKLASAVDAGPAQHVSDVTYGFHGRRSMDLDGWVLRLRRHGEVVVLGYKGRTDDRNEWLDVEVVVSSLRGTALLLQLIGMRPGLLIDRRRREARRSGWLISIDEVRWLGAFVEVEVAPEANLTMSLSEVRSLLGVASEPEAPPYGDALLTRLEDPDVRAEHDLALRRFVES